MTLGWVCAGCHVKRKWVHEKEEDFEHGTVEESGASEIIFRLRGESYGKEMARGVRNERREEDPCSFVGYEVKMSSDAILIGSGDYEKCALGLKKQIQKMLTEDGNGNMRLPKALLSEDVGETKKFLGMSLLYHVTHFISVVMPSSLVTFPKPTLLEITDAGKSLCATNWNVVSSEFDGEGSKHAFG